jgi:hypothetical protein
MVVCICHTTNGGKHKTGGFQSRLGWDKSKTVSPALRFIAKIKDPISKMTRAKRTEGPFHKHLSSDNSTTKNANKQTKNPEAPKF